MRMGEGESAANRSSDQNFLATQPRSKSCASSFSCHTRRRLPPRSKSHLHHHRPTPCLPSVVWQWMEVVPQMFQLSCLPRCFATTGIATGANIWQSVLTHCREAENAVTIECWQSSQCKCHHSSLIEDANIQLTNRNWSWSLKHSGEIHCHKCWLKIQGLQQMFQKVKIQGRPSLQRKSFHCCSFMRLATWIHGWVKHSFTQLFVQTWKEKWCRHSLQ